MRAVKDSDKLFRSSNNINENNYESELNLLLRHQTIKRFMDMPQETYYEEEYNFTVPKEANFKDYVLENRCEELKIKLANIQLEETLALEQHKVLTDSYNLLEIAIEHVLNHIDCIILEVKSAGALSSCLNAYSAQEQYTNEQISISLKQLNENYDLSTFKGFKAKLLTILYDNSSDIKKLYNEFRERECNYKLALKNFKIILEILNVDENSLGKLKQQFDEVLMDYQHCRCILDHELPFAIAERNKVLADCLIFLGTEYARLVDRRNVLSGLFKDIGRKVLESEYILVKEEVISPCSTAND